MRTYITRVLAIAGLLFLLATPLTVSAAAYRLQDNVDCSAGSDSTVCQTTGTEDPLTGNNGIIRKATMIIAVIAGIAAAIVMIVAGFNYITSNGDAETVSKAKKAIIYGAVGLIVIVVGQAIINFVISRI